MAKILGLDLGTNSIGWAVVDDDKQEILGMGSRIFPEGVVAKTIGTGEKEESKNAARRNSRQQRRQYYRKRLRKIKLLRTLIDLEMCPLTHKELDLWANWDKSKGKAGRIAPSSKAYIEWHRQNPYHLRDKALNEDLTLHEMGRVLYHLIQRRGFLSNRKGKDDGKIYKGKEGMVGIDQTKNSIDNGTLGSFLNSIYPREGEPFQLIIDENGNELRVRARYTLRDMYVEEFDKIWERQAEPLGLFEKTGEKKKLTFLKGNLDANRNKKKIEKLYQKYGEPNVTITEIENKVTGKSIFKVVVKSIVPLKEFFGGEIEYDEEGKIKHKSQDSVLFWQRPLRSQKGLLAKCRFEPTVTKNGKYLQRGKSPCHLSHPVYEEFRAYQFINNIEYGRKQKLNEFQRLQVLDLMNGKDSNFNFSEIPKKLKMEYEKWNYADDQKVPGNYTTKHLSSLFSKEVWEKHKDEIWHCFMDFEDNDNLIEKLISDFDLNEKLIDKVERINLKEGYSNVSLKAIKNILPFLREGFQMSDATILGGVMNAFGDQINYFKDSEEQLKKDVLNIVRDKTNKEGDAIKKIRSYLVENDFGFASDDKRFIKLYHHSQDIETKELKDKLDAIENLRNPIVQQGLNETRRLVNHLIGEYGKFDRIQVELGRDVKNSKQGRQNQSDRIKENTTKNDAARKLLTEYGLRHDRDNIQKVLLYKEMQDRGVVTVCPYTNISINISDVLGRENKIQIEHIMPKSTSLNDSFGNKTLCDSKFNGLKGNLTPYQFYLKNNDPKIWGGAETWEDIEQRIYRLLPYPKAKRFTSKIKIEDTDVQNSFIERQLNDTRYISKKTKEIMSQVCEDVRVLPGGLTSELRHLWGLNNILQPVMNLDISVKNMEEDRAYPHYVVMDENNNLISSLPIYNEKPTLEANQTTITGKVDKGVFKTLNNYVNITISVPELTNGNYWLKLNISEPKKVVRIFKERPESIENTIVLRGNVEREKFKNNGVGIVSAEGIDNGSYWAKLPVLDKKFIVPEKEKQPKKTGKQILLFGEVKDNYFKSYIYECETNTTDGRYWLLLDIDTENPVYERAINEKPSFASNQICIEGTVNNQGVFVSEIDAEHQFAANEKEGKYWVVYDIVNEPNEFNAIENQKPPIEENQSLIEGNIWADKYTGEIKFDPKKNRDDHRHHAIDALVIALSKQSYFQQLSTYNAQRVAKYKGLPFEKDQLNFPEPWLNFHTSAKKEAEKILVSHKQNRKVLTQVRKRITKNGKTFTSVGDAVRGQLHKENVYGQRQAPMEVSKGYHMRKKVSDLKDNQLKKIVDPEIRRIITKARTEEVKINKEIALLEKQKKQKGVSDEEELGIVEQIYLLKNDIQHLYTLKNKNGERVPIKKVRVREEMSNAQKLKDSNQYVNPRNNHHVLIYKNDKGELDKSVVNFWTAVERERQNVDLFQLPEDGLEIVQTFQENDMFLLFLEQDTNVQELSEDIIFNHLFKVQKIAGADYFMEICFRRHLDGKSSSDAEYVYIKGFGSGKTGWNSFNPIKVNISHTGKLIKA
ncbi:type II CRISPR RNA-guided endonuclease Cas9 [Gelidibacter japonicus]|uniref:type II CRISPR RNA-guided endonuclease Cas9 n=1 Tax=Gelidibacter japonicus TaxID=1962232 RepID=UPI0020222FA0|nr:type II CRISPR RNA-guided endonuclease Cas9 [Gelidibacter japonicus]MCL8008789.1 type II CRISPR RNA-guided endonuclease Cas9 [Gelidibacter japonicus]